jgi:electron transfer flavoprotein alpha/beta subunit
MMTTSHKDEALDYRCIVCVKQVPDTAHITGDAMKADGTVNRNALPAIINPDDLHALEAALAVREQHGGTVTVITMGPLGAAEALRDCLYRGADRAVLINDRRAAASDTLATSYILSQAVRKLGAYDLVFCGRQAIDGDTAQVGPQMAEKLGLVQITYLERFVELADRTARVRRNVGNGWEVLEARLPLLVTTLDTANDPRPPAARRVAAGHAVQAGPNAGRGETRDQAGAGRPDRGTRGRKPAHRAVGPGRHRGGPDVVRYRRLAHEGAPRAVHRPDQVRLQGGQADRAGHSRHGARADR